VTPATAAFWRCCATWAPGRLTRHLNRRASRNAARRGLRTAQQEAQASASLAQAAEETGDVSLANEAQMAGQNAMDALQALQEAGDQPATEVTPGEAESQLGRQLSKDEIQRLHMEISGQGLGRDGIIERAITMFGGS
jgi:hypothetical protein